MSKSFDRRSFLKRFSGAALGTAAFASGAGASLAGGAAEVTVWGGPGGDVLESPDYEVSIRADERTWTPFVYYSFNRPYDKTLDYEGKYVKLSFLALHSNEYRRPEENKDTYAHSWTHFDFSGGPVEVQVRFKRAFAGLTLPLRDCAILPRALGLRCEIVSGDTIRFTLSQPAKIAIVANRQLALDKLQDAEPKQAFEGYRNPLFLFARAPETDVPDKSAPGTLVIEPGQSYGMKEFAAARTIYFEPGVHDYSRHNPDDPDHYIELRSGQTMYLAGGAYVYGHIASPVARPIGDMPRLRGRGTMSGIKQRWTDFPYKTCEEKNVWLEGIQIADAHNHISHSISPVKDVAVVGAWHGNTDGITREVPDGDPYDGWHVDDCFIMAGDSNLKGGGVARLRNCTLWQLNNAEPIWIRNPIQCVVENIHVLAYNKWPKIGAAVPGQVFNFPARRATQRNAIIRNISIEAPFVPLLFYMPSSDMGDRTAYENVVFENVIVDTPHIRMKSPFGPQSSDGSRFGQVAFRNLTVNGVKVTARNCSDYFDLLNGAAAGKEIVFE